MDDCLYVLIKHRINDFTILILNLTKQASTIRHRSAIAVYCCHKSNKTFWIDRLYAEPSIYWKSFNEEFAYLERLLHWVHQTTFQLRKKDKAKDYLCFCLSSSAKTEQQRRHKQIDYSRLNTFEVNRETPKGRSTQNKKNVS